MDSDRQHAISFLHYIQQNTYESLGISPKWHSSDHSALQETFLKRYYDSLVKGRSDLTFDEFRHRFIKKNVVLNDESIGLFQHPGWHSLLREMCSEIEKVIKDKNISLAQSPLFGTLPTGRVNGIVISVPQSKYFIILIEEGLFGFANLASKAITRAFPLKKSDKEGYATFSTEDADWMEEIDSNPDRAEKFAELLFAYLIGGDPHRSTPYLPEPQYDNLASAMRSAMELFVVGHEYGHIVSGHLSGGDTKKTLVGTEETDEVLPSWQQEFEADVRGLDFMLTAMMQRGYDISLSFWGASFFFSCIEIIERALSILRTGNHTQRVSETHPPSKMRRELLHEVLRQSIPEEHSSGAIQLSEVVDSVLNQYWIACEPILLSAYKEGIELAPAWQV